MVYFNCEVRKEGAIAMRMLRVTQKDDGSFCLKQNPGALSIFMFFLGFMLLRVGFSGFGTVSIEDGSDYIGIIFIAVWLLIGLSVLVFGVLHRFFIRVEISAKGILYSSWFRKKDILWSELKDYGISFDSRNRNTNSYSLYFSDEVLPEKNRNSKKLKGVGIRLDMLQSDYAGVYTKLIPYCSQFTGLKPFLPDYFY